MRDCEAGGWALGSVPLLGTLLGRRPSTDRLRPVPQMQPLRSTVTRSPPSPWDLQLLQQQACPTVPREQFLQLQQQLLQAERRSQHLQEELDNRASETNTPQVQSALLWGSSHHPVYFTFV